MACRTPALPGRSLLVSCAALVMLGSFVPARAGAPIVDCNDNGIPDDLDIASGTSDDCNENAVPDECDNPSALIVAKFLPTGFAEGDWFGYSCAVEGDTAVVGAIEDGEHAGSAYVFVRTAGVWAQQANVVPLDSRPFALFGTAVSISGDTLIAGAPDAIGPDGAAYVFVRSGSNWSQQAKLTASEAPEEALFGQSVSIDGDTAVVGAPWDSHAGQNSGTAYVFVRQDGQWTEQARLDAPDAEAGDQFGWSVDLCGDTLIIGADSDDHDGVNLTGSAYVFVRSEEQWTFEVKLTMPDPQGGRFGASVSLDGDTAVVGANTYNPGGTAFVFVRDGGAWMPQAQLTAIDAGPGDQFGRSVAVKDDLVVIGAFADNALDGSAYVFSRAGSTWTQVIKLFSLDYGGTRFGTSVAVSGNTVFAGAPFDSERGFRAGAVHVFDLLPHTSFDCNDNGVPDECDLEFGTSLDCNGNGVPNECDIAGGFTGDNNGNQIPDDCETDLGPWDYDFDGDVDLIDFYTFVRCFGSPGQTQAECDPDEYADSDFDGDGAVTLVDFITFASAFTG